MKTTCQYCKGSTLDDVRGNCSACGAPKLQKETTTATRLSDSQIEMAAQAIRDMPPSGMIIDTNDPVKVFGEVVSDEDRVAIWDRAFFDVRWHGGFSLRGSGK